MAHADDAVLAPRYLAGFRCLAEACEDSCCQGWRASVDAATFARWQLAFGVDGADALVERGRADRVHLRVVGDDRCAQLDDDRLCALQRALGEDGLADTCAVFPRVLQVVGDRLEATASLACPEIARRSLLGVPAGDDAHALVTIARTAVYERTPHTRVAAGEARTPWIALGPPLRDAIDRALAGDATPIATRLFAIARLAEATRHVFRPGAGAADAARFRAALADAFTPAALAAAGAELDSDAPAAFAGAAIVTDLLATLLQGARAPAFRALVERSLAGTDEPRGEVACGARRLSPARLWTAHDARMAALTDGVLARLDALDVAWARHAWRQRWHLHAPDLFAHAMLHLVDRALGRVLLAAHPRLEVDVDGAAIDAIHLLARHLEHAGLHDQLAARLVAGGHATRAVARSLLLF